MQMIRSGDNRKTQLLSQLDQKIFFSVHMNSDSGTERYAQDDVMQPCPNTKHASPISGEKLLGLARKSAISS